MRSTVTKRSRYEREQRAAQNIRARELAEAMQRSVTAEQAAAFEVLLAAARARGPIMPPPDMAPGTPPRPPRPGHEPRPKKEERPRSRH